MDVDTFKYKDTGIVLNSDPAFPDSPFVDVMRIEGLSNAPFRVTERDREGMDGGYVDALYERMRTIVIEGVVYCPSDTLEAYLDQLKDNFAPTSIPFPLYFQPPGVGERVVFCKSYGIKYDWATTRRIGTTEIQIQLIAEDPTIYDTEPLTGSTGLPTETTGRRYDKSYDYGYTETVFSPYGDDYHDVFGDTYGTGTPVAVVQSGGIIGIHNSGNKPTGAYITIFGPIENPGIVHEESGRELVFNIIIASDQYMTIDLRSKTVLLMGTSNRRHTLVNTSRWFMLPPGDNSFRLTGSDPVGGSPDPAMTILARSAYR